MWLHIGTEWEKERQQNEQAQAANRSVIEGIILDIDSCINAVSMTYWSEGFMERDGVFREYSNSLDRFYYQEIFSRDLVLSY